MDEFEIHGEKTEEGLHSENPKIHEKRHTDEKPFKCKKCDQTFNNGEKLKQHEKNHWKIKIASINIQCAQQGFTGKTLYEKEEQLLNTIWENDLDIVGISE